MSATSVMNISLWRRLAAAFLFGLCIAAAPAGAAEDGDAPVAILESTLQRMLETLREERQTLKQEPERIYSLVDEILVPKVDFVRASRWVLGRHWRRADNAQKRAFIKEFRTLLVRFYSSALVEYVTTNEVPGADIMRFLPLRAAPHERDVTVRSEVRQPNGSVIPVHYQMYRTKQGWKVYDVSVEGISMVVSYRSSFATEISQGGIDGLIQALRERNESLAVNNG